MDISEYQRKALRTRGEYQDQSDQLVCSAMGLAGETGELVDYLKKVLYHGHPLNTGIAVKELGDVLWYCCLMADALGVDISQVATENIRKLEERYPNGFSHELSMNRVR